MSYTRSYHHIVFGTRFRIPCLWRDRKPRLYEYIKNVAKNKKCDIRKINGIEDHVHILVDIHPTVSLSDFVKTIKQASSRWISEVFLFPNYEGWSKEYFACSVSPSHLPAVETYIDNQETHHTSNKYEDEMATFVEKMGMVIYKDVSE